MTTSDFNPQQIAREAAEQIAIKYIEPPDKAQDWADIRTDLQALILSAASRMVRESGAVEGLETAIDFGDFVANDSAVPRIRAALQSLRCITDSQEAPPAQS